MALPDSLPKRRIESLNKGQVYTDQDAPFLIKTGKSGTMHASSLCNINGLRESTQEISIAMKYRRN